MRAKKTSALNHTKPASGFSLVELAVVLVVVGIVIGGVMMGQQLLERSRFNKVFSDTQRYAEAVMQFQRTYGGLPGDLSNAAVYFPSLTVADNGNGNGVIDATEEQLFWTHLRASGLFKEGMQAVATGVADPKSGIDGLGYAAKENATLGVVMELTAYQAGVSGYAALTPEEAMIMEANDDGNPATGRVRAALGNGAVGNCTTSVVVGGVTTESYDLTNSGKACILRFMTKEMAGNAASSRDTEAACGTVGETRSTGVACPVGYRGQVTETCAADGTWQTSNNGCVIVDCDGGVYEETRVIGCGTGYSGEITQTCTAGGVWATSASTCTPVHGSCSVLDEKKTVACPEGKIGGLTLRCDGTVWQDFAGSCDNTNCDGSEIGETRTVACPTGYTGNQLEVCSANGTWLPKDLNSTCMLATGETCTTANDTRTLSCQAGYSGSITQTCNTVNAALVWVTTSNSCKITMCGDMPVGYSRDSTTLCDGSTTVYQKEICGSDGKWALSPNSCPTLSGCTLPWGGSTAHGTSVSAFSTASVILPSTCPAASTRTCSNGTLSGSGDYASCAELSGGDCTLPWGGTVADGGSVSAYSASTGNPCPAATTRTCTAGTLSGSGNYASCVSDCALPWGGTIASGASVSSYAAASGIPCPAAVIRTCVDGELSSGGDYASCLSGCLLPWGGSIAHGASVNAYSRQYSQPTVNSCPAAVVRTCNNGSLSNLGTLPGNIYPSCAVAQSCADLRDSGWGYTTNGTYMVDADGGGAGAAFSVYCNMTTDGGGWTLVAAQFESNPATNWNEGKQADYDPTLATAKSLALNTAQIGPHNSIAFGRGLAPTFVDWTPGTYSTANIAKTLLPSIKSGLFYHIYRNASNSYAGAANNPEGTLYGTNAQWDNILTFDELGGAKYSWAFGPNLSSANSTYRGYAMAGTNLAGSTQTYAWTVWTNRRNDVYTSCAAVKANALNTASGVYTIQKFGNVYCDMESSNGSFLSCTDALEKDMLTSGKYSIDPDGAGAVAAYVTYCDQTHDGGGWTMIVAQYENDPETNWNIGVANNYDPGLTASPGISMVLSTAQIPSHNEVAFGRGLNATFVDYVPFTYTTGNIPKTLVDSAKTLKQYHIYRNSANSYAGAANNPEGTLYGTNAQWDNILTFDELGGAKYSWAFGPNLSSANSTYRGYAMAGTNLAGSTQTYAWTIWVRTRPVYNNCAAVLAAGNTTSGLYEIKNFGWVNCDMTVGGNGSFTSCTDAQNKGMTADDEYSIDPDGAGPTAAFIGYCNMTLDGGGWLLVAAQFEAYPSTNWNAGVTKNYDMTLAAGKSVILSTAQIPSHNEVGFGRGLTPTFVDRIPYNYTTGNIAKTLVTSRKSGTSYHIFRNSSNSYAGAANDPEGALYGTNTQWNNIFTLDEIGGAKYSWAFGPNLSSANSTYRGYAMAGTNLAGSTQTYAWTVWVRSRTDIYANCAAAKTAGNTVSGLYDINIHGRVYCDMSVTSGVFASCKDAKDKGMNINGRYMIDPDGAGAVTPFVAYCNQATDGGGWTLIAAQYENGPVGWNAGMNSSYEPTLTSAESFTLNTSQIPAHTDIGFGRGLSPTFVDWVLGTYTTGNIAKTLKTSTKTGKSYHIYRNSANSYAGAANDPEGALYGTNAQWNNILTFDELGGAKYSWAFGPNLSSANSTYRGYAMAGTNLAGSTQTYAWTIWVR